jgi:polyisoprenoid-binding protein YceI
VFIGIGAVIALAVGGFLVWFYVIKSDPPKRLDASDLDKALGATTVAVAGAPTTTQAPGTTTASTTATTTASAGSGSSADDDGADGSASIDGTWNISTDSTLGYRVKEVLAGLDTEAVGRTNQVNGSMTISGTTVDAADFTVDVASIKSDDGRRDGQFRGQIMSASQFPEATFKLTKPIELGSVPATGQTVTVSATGDLTLRGKTNPVTFDIQAKLDNGRIGALGNIPVTFADYGISNPSNGIAKVGDTGTLEFVLVFDHA